MTPHGHLTGIKAVNNLYLGNNGEYGPGYCGLLEGMGSVILGDWTDEQFDDGLDPAGADGVAGVEFVVDQFDSIFDDIL